MMAWAHKTASSADRCPQMRVEDVLIAVRNAFGCQNRLREIVKRGLLDFQNVNGNMQLLKAFFVYVEAIEVGAAAATKKTLEEIVAARDAKERARSRTAHRDGQGSSGASYRPGRSGKTSFDGTADGAVCREDQTSKLQHE